MDAVDRNLGPFQKRGGKIVMYLGWDDPIHLPQSALNYYKGVQHVLGGSEKTQEFFRVFIVPGLGHCSGGPGLNTVDALPALEAWVERGVAPDKIIASRVSSRVTERTRPVCPYPEVARWSGHGSTDDASNFACVKEPASPAASKP